MTCPRAQCVPASQEEFKEEAKVPKYSVHGSCYYTVKGVNKYIFYKVFNPELKPNC